jgi:glycosidase
MVSTRRYRPARRLAWLLAGALVAGIAPPVATAAAHGIRWDALLHDTFATDYRAPGGPVAEGAAVRLRLRTAAGDAAAVVLRVYRYEAASDSTVATDTPMPRVSRSGPYDLYAVTVHAPLVPSVLYYKFHVEGTAGDQVWYADDQRFDGDDRNQGGVGAASSDEPFPAFQITVYDPHFATPQWLHDAVIYQVFPDRFRNGDPSNDPCRPGSPAGCPVYYGDVQATLHPTWNEPVEDPHSSGIWNRDFFGGDLAGVQQKLDYLQRLGVTTVYLNPIFTARSNHRYDTDDYMQVDPALGGDAALASLVTAVQARHMHLILDGVFNHASSDSRYFDRYHRYPADGACESLTSPYRSWFAFTSATVPCGSGDYESFYGIDTLPQFAHDDPAVRGFFYRAGAGSVLGRWDQAGAAGWRFDAAFAIDHGWWRDLRTYAKSYASDGPLIGEVWDDASQYLLGDQLDSVMNYRFAQGVLGFVRSADWSDDVGYTEASTPSQLDHALHAQREDYPPAALAAMLNLIDSHDTNRALFMYTEPGDHGLVEAKQRLRLASLLQFTYLGAPMVLYGDEAAIDAPALTAGPNGPNHDPYVRAPYPWADQSGDASVYGPADGAMIAWYQRLAQLRSAHPALRSGSYTTLLTGDTTPDPHDDGVFAFARASAHDAAVIMLNKSSASDSARFAVGRWFADRTRLTDALTGAHVVVTGGYVRVTLAPRTGAVLLAG